MNDMCININTFYIVANEMNNELALLDPDKRYHVDDYDVTTQITSHTHFTQEYT